MFKSRPIGFRRRLAALIGLLGMLVAMLAAVPGSPAAATVAKTPHRAAPGTHVIVGDPAARQVYVLRGSDLRVTGQLRDVKLGAHVGTIALTDGRVLMVDDATGRLLVVRISPQGRPAVTQRVPLAFEGEWHRAGWAAVDSKSRWFAVGTDADGASRQTVTIVDLKTYKTHRFDVALTPNAAGGAYSEMHVYLAGRPLQLVLTTGGAFTAYPLAEILAGRTPAASSSVPLDPNPHGPIVAPDGSRVLTTTADGIGAADIPADRLVNPRSIAYSATRDIVQNYRPRLSPDGHTVVGTAAEATGLTPAQWAQTRNVLHVFDLADDSSRLIRLPDGIAGRVATSSRYAVAASIQADGDVLSIIDLRPGSRTRLRLVGLVVLPGLTNGPVPGQPAAGREGRASGITPDGSRAYVTSGGEGIVTLIDVDHRGVIRSVQLPTPLTGGGYVSVVREGVRPVDLVAR